MRKHNQAKRKYSYKNDEIDLVDICQFIRDTFPQYKVKREWYIFWGHDNKAKSVSLRVPIDNIYRYRHPDIMMFEDKKLILAYEIDGAYHNIDVEGTLLRNQEYRAAGVPLLISNTEDNKIKKVDIYDDIYKKINDFLSGE